MNGNFDVTLACTGMNGWIDKAKKPTNQSQTVTNLQLLLGGFTVLECQPDTNSPGSPIRTGDQRHHQLDQWRLLVLNFSLEESKKEAHYECFVSGLEYFNKDIKKMYTLSISEGEE